MSLSDYFKRLGAPLVNNRWSWGAIREDGAIVLRVWQHECKRIDEAYWVHLTEELCDEEEKNQVNQGYQERDEHVARIKQGARVYLVMCQAENPSVKRVKSFNEREVFVGGELREANGHTWLEIADRIPASSVGSDAK